MLKNIPTFCESHPNPIRFTDKSPPWSFFPYINPPSSLSLSKSFSSQLPSQTSRNQLYFSTLMAMDSSLALSQSDQENLLEELGIFKIQGRDKAGRKVLLITGKHFPGKDNMQFTWGIFGDLIQQLTPAKHPWIMLQNLKHFPCEWSLVKKAIEKARLLLSYPPLKRKRPRVARKSHSWWQERKSHSWRPGCKK